MGRSAYSDRLTTNDCRAITTKFLNKRHYFDGGIRTGQITWSRNGEKISSVGIWVSTLCKDEYVRLFYTHTILSTGQETKVDYKIKIVSTPCQYGGIRWWFICPLNKNGNPCNKRVTTLYGRKYYGCRHCHNLTYDSCKDSHKSDRFFLKMGLDPKEVKEAFKRERELWK